jgi:hypothetical protein
MPRKQEPYEPHTYSVFVDFIEADGTFRSELHYFGDSEFSAVLRFAEAIVKHEDAYSVVLRKDGRAWRRVKIERPPAVP